MASSKDKEESSTNKPAPNNQPGGKPPVSRKLFSETKQNESKEYTPGPEEDEDMLTDNFESEGESSLNINCNVVSVLPCEFGQETEVEEREEDDAIDLTKHRPVCYYVMDNGAVEEQNAFFEYPEPAMQNHLKPLFIRAKVGTHGVNKVLVDGGAAVNLMPHFMLKKLGIQDVDIKPHNMVLSNYEGKVGHTLGVIQVDLTVRSSCRPTMFMVIEAKANYNLLLGREWIHGVGAVPSSMHQRLVLWREDGIVENIEADQSYFMTAVNLVDKRNYDKHLAKIAPCTPNDEINETRNAHYYMTLRHDGMYWDRRIIKGDGEVEGATQRRPAGWEFDSLAHD